MSNDKPDDSENRGRPLGSPTGAYVKGKFIGGPGTTAEPSDPVGDRPTGAYQDGEQVEVPEPETPDQQAGFTGWFAKSDQDD